LLLAIFLLGGCASYEPPQPCEPEARAHLARLAVSAQEIEELTVRTDARAGRSSTKILSHTAWTRVKSCDGHLIVVMGAGASSAVPISRTVAAECPRAAPSAERLAGPDYSP
jgi:hypothetical protein